MQHDHIVEKLNFYLLTPSPGSRVSACKIFATMLLHSWFSLIWYVTLPCSEKFEFWPTDPIPKVRGKRTSTGKIFATMLLRSVIPIKLICNMTMFYLPQGQGWGVGRGFCGQNICYHIAAFVILFNLICNMTVFWKSWILAFWPSPLSPQGVRHSPLIENHV